MTSWLENLNNPAITALGYTLLHTLWQGALTTLLLLMLRRLFRTASADLKYWMAVTAMVGMVVWMSTTFFQEFNQARESLATNGAVSSPESLASALPSQVLAYEVSQSKLWEQKINLWYLSLQPYLPIAVGVWLFGVLLFLLRMEGGLFYLRRLKQSGYPAPLQWQEKMLHLAHRMDLRRKVRLLESKLIEVPMVVGHLKPIVLLPVGVFTGLSTDQVAAILAHELSHIKRCDYLINLGQNVIEALLFFNPFAWWISAKIREEREICCDDQAVKICGDQFTYARALTGLQDFVINKPTLGMTLFKKQSHLLSRVKRLLQPSRNAISLREKVISGSLLLCLLFVLSWQAQSFKTPQTEGSLMAKTGLWQLATTLSPTDTIPPEPLIPPEIELAPEVEELVEIENDLELLKDINIDLDLDLAIPDLAPVPSFDDDGPAVWVAPNHNGPGVLPDDFLAGVDFDDVVVRPFGSFQLDSLPDLLELVQEYQKVLDQELKGKLSQEEIENIRAQMEKVTQDIEVEIRDLDHQLRDQNYRERAPKEEHLHEMESRMLEKEMELHEKLSHLKGVEREEVRRQMEMAREQMALAREQLRQEASQRNLEIARVHRDEQRRQREIKGHVQRQHARAQRDLQREKRERISQVHREHARALRHKEHEDRSAVARTEITKNLLADGIIENQDDRVKLDYQNNLLRINGKKISGDQKAKYMDILHRHYRLKDTDNLKFEFSPNRSSMSHESE